MAGKRSFLLIIIVAASLFFSGCIEIDILVKVNPDGSGIISQKVMIQEALVSMSEVINQSKPNRSTWNDSAAYNRIGKLYGEGVKLKDVKQVKTAQVIGYTAQYTFTDINKLQLRMDAADYVTDDIIESVGGLQYRKIAQPVTFQLDSKLNNQLVVNNPLATAEFAVPTTDNPVLNSINDKTFNDDFVSRLGDMYGFKLLFAVESVGKKSTTKGKNNRVTLYNVDFAKVLKNRSGIATVKEKKPKNYRELMQYASLLQGVEILTQQEILIQLK